MLLKRDPVDEDVPYCTLKSFPAIMDHCIEWARDKVFHPTVDSIHIHTAACSHIFYITIVLKYLVANSYVESCFVVVCCVHHMCLTRNVAVDIVCCAQFETIFSQKPSLYNKFWTTHHTPQTAASVSFVTMSYSSFFSLCLLTCNSNINLLVILASVAHFKLLNIYGSSD